MGETIQIRKKVIGDGKSFIEKNLPVNEIKQKPEPLGTIEINTDEKKEKEDEIIEMDFQDENVLNDFTKQKTKEAQPLNTEENKFSGTTEQIKAQILSEEESKSGASKPEDVRMWAGLLINVFDTGISTLLKFFSGDNSAEPYSISKPKKNELADQLTIILIKHSAKFKIEILFLIAIVAAYAGPVGTAMATRKKIKKAQEELPPPDRHTTQTIKQEIKEVIISENTNTNQEPEAKPTIKIRRRRGNPGKG